MPEFHDEPTHLAVRGTLSATQALEVADSRRSDPSVTRPHCRSRFFSGVEDHATFLERQVAAAGTLYR